MKNICKIFTLSALGLMACQKEAPEQPVPQPGDRMPIALSMDFGTKVSDTNYDQGDQVGIYVVNYQNGQPQALSQSNYYNNVKMTYTTTWEQTEQMYWKDKVTPADFYCYHPYSASIDPLSHSFPIKTSQAALQDYKASDFTWGKAGNKAPTKEVIRISSRHILSRINILLKKGKGFSTERWTNAAKNVTIDNLYTTAQINLSDGSVSPAGSINVVTPYTVGPDSYKAVVVPQTVTNGTALLTITVDGVQYHFKKNFTFQSGIQHNFTVTVNRTGSGIDIGVEDWGSDGTDNGGDAE